MTNPTSNFGWVMPSPTSLVTNLPADFNTFGQAVDTSMAELKGGTTGQVLSKTSATDMDFTWVTTDDANAIQNAIVNAKGDLIAASANDVPAIISVGNNGETLVADSSTSTGLRYQGSMAAAKNAIINGNFDIWQRGTTSGSAGYQTADRWFENATASTTFAQESTIVPDGSRYSFKMTAGATAQMIVQQAIETLNSLPFANKTVTASALVSASVSTGMSVNLFYSTSVDVAAGGSWTQITATSGGTATAVSGSFVKLSGVYSVPSTAKSIMMQVQTTATVASGVIVYVAQAQLELGSVPTTFTRAGGTIQGELAACQRYYWRGTGPSNTPYGGGVSWSGTKAYINVQFPITMRVSPTSIDFSSLYISNPGLSSIAVTNVTQVSGGTFANVLEATVASGATGGSFYTLQNNGASGFLGLNAEL